MMEYFLVYNGDSGEVLSRGQGPAGTAAIQQLEEGMAVMVVPRQAVQTLGTVNLDAIRTSFAASIDMDADKVRGMFITNTLGQMATYMEKEAEARRVLAGDASNAVFLPLEAEALGKDLAQLAQEVIAQADFWRPIGARIEAARRLAKTQLEAAENLAVLHQATQIDWQAVVAPGAA